MARIFSILALVTVGLLGVNIALGLVIGDYGGVARQWVEARQEVRELEKGYGVAPEQLEAARQRQAEVSERFRPVRQRATLHILLGIAAALLTVLVNSITVTYFIGTSRWCREVSEAYSLDPDLPARSDQLKRRTFPWALLSIVAILVVVALGAASDPGASLYGSARWVTPHMLSGLLGTALIGWALLVQVNNIRENYQVIEEILGHVRRIRIERGLESEQ